MAQVSGSAYQTVRENGKTYIYGVDETMKVLKSVDKDLAKELNKKFVAAGRIVANAARPRYPRRTGAARRSVRVYQGGRNIRRGGGVGMRNRRTVRLAGFRVEQQSRGGSIIEFAAQSRGSARGKTLAKTLNAKYGSPGRFLWQAMDENKAEVSALSNQAVRDAEAKLNQRLGVQVFVGR